jgi:caffeoyl-CoA O-methyltransferase
MDGMTIQRSKIILAALLFGVALVPAAPGVGQDPDARIKAFLDERQGHWRDLNIPAADGQILYDLIVARGYKRALEIGTSTGHSGTWIAWALSKTGGRLTTIEIDPQRREQAVRNFQAAGLAGRIESLLGDAHELASRQEGPFDFVFSDADKEWYVNYAKAVIPKLLPGGCLAAHNISPGRGGFGRGFGGGNAGYYDYMKSLPDFDTSMAADRSSLAVSYKSKAR